MPTALVINLPEHGHMNATFPLVAELVARGERVVYLGTEAWRSRIEASGATYAAYAEPQALFDPPAHRGGLYSVMAYLMDVAERVLPDVLHQIARVRPDYLLIDSMCVWGRLAQQVTGLPAVTLGSVFVPDDTRVSMEQMVRQAYGQAPREVLLAGVDALNTYLQVSQRVDRRYGTSSPTIVEFFANRQPLNVIFTSRYFHLAGDEYDDSYLFVGPSMAARRGEPSRTAVDGASDAVDDVRPLIYVSLGTIFNDQAAFFRTVADALGGGPWRVIVSTGQRVSHDAIGPVADNITLRESVAQLEVLSRASLCVTHGGMNTTSEALWHGVPLIVCPQHGDQHLVAARVAELGAGVRVTPPDLDPSRLRALVTRVFEDPAFAREARRIADSFRSAGGCRRAADAIVAHVETRTRVAAGAAS